MKRSFDIFLAMILLAVFSIPMLIIAISIKVSSKGNVLYWSDRIGKDNKTFSMPKFRTMRVGTPEVATHLLTDNHNYVTLVGRLLRKTSLDELPQLWSVLKGDMSFVGPRPALYNQHDLIDLRTKTGVYTLCPGITGWAQINGRDELTIDVKVRYDQYYLKNRSFLFDLSILAKTLFKAPLGLGVSH